MKPSSEFGVRPLLKRQRTSRRSICGGRSSELKIPLFSLSCFLLVIFLGFPMAQAQAVEKIKEIVGEVGFLRSDMISVEYYRKGGAVKEVLIPLDGGTALKTIGNLTEIKKGDTVRVAYKETYVLDPDGTRSYLKRVATQISLLKRAPTDSLQTMVTREGKLQ